MYYVYATSVSIPNDPVCSRVYLSSPKRGDIREPWVFPLQYFEQLHCLLSKIPPGLFYLALLVLATC